MSWYSVRMRAAAGGAHEAGGRHISGGERLVPAAEIAARVQELVDRALTHEQGRADFINVSVELVPTADVQAVEALPIGNRPVGSVAQGRADAVALLIHSGVSALAAQRAVELLAAGPAPGGQVMRGAVVMDADSGERLETDPTRGVRVTRLDWHPETRAQFVALGAPRGRGSERVLEAVALATNVVRTPGTVAELCWSDDPSYVAGYVASPTLGYVRVTQLKEPGDPLGGRVFFVRGVDAADYEAALQVPMLISRLPLPLFVDDLQDIDLLGREAVPCPTTTGN